MFPKELVRWGGAADGIYISDETIPQTTEEIVQYLFRQRSGMLHNKWIAKICTAVYIDSLTFDIEEKLLAISKPTISVEV